MANQLHLKIVSPTKIVFEKDVDMVIMRGVLGDLGILPGHEQLTTLLGYGPLKYIIEDEEEEIAVLGGFAEITEKGVTILSDASELPEEIDINRAQKAKERAEERLNSNSDDVDLLRAETALHKALVRLEVGEHKNKTF